MEAFHVLEQKIAQLVEIIKELRAENMRLCEDNSQMMQEKANVVEQMCQLKSQMEQMEHSILKGHQNIEELNQERELTKMVVGDLIKSIDILVEREQQ